MTLVPDVPVTRLLDDAARVMPSAPALAIGSRTLTYRQLQDQADRFAQVLIRLGVRRGERVALVLPDCPALAIAFFGVLRLGAVVVTHNPRSGPEPLRHQLADCGAEIVVCSQAESVAVLAVRAQSAVREVIVVGDRDPAGAGLRGGARRLPRSGRAEAMHSWAEVLRGAPPTRPDVSLDPGMVAALAYTAGTAGPGRGAILTHRNLVANAHQCSWWLGSRGPGQDVVLCLLPLFHPFGLTLGLTTTMVRGGLLMVPAAGDGGPKALLAAMARLRPTVLAAVAPQLQALLADPAIGPEHLAALRVAVTPGLPVPDQLRAAWQAKLPAAALLEAYGMAETTALTHGRPLGGSAEPARTGEIGRPLPLTEARVVSADDPQAGVAVGASGELVVRGPQIFGGYWGRPDAAEMLLPAGWMRTGDLVTEAPDGTFTLLGRMPTAETLPS